MKADIDREEGRESIEKGVESWLNEGRKWEARRIDYETYRQKRVKEK